MLTCKQASQIISQSLERKLSWNERFALKLHLFICKYCLRFSQQLHTLRVALKRINENVENDTNIRMPSETKARIAKSIESVID
jgi:argininosuccinate lyase